MAAGLALVLSFWPKSKRAFLPTFMVAWLGVTVHIVSDLWTSYGTRALLPFDSTWFAWDWIFIVDPMLLALLAIACFGARWSKRPSTTRWAAAAVVAYIGVRAGVHAQALGQAQSLAGSEYTLVRAFPSPVDINDWRFLARNETAFARGSVQAFGTSREKETIARQSPDALVTRIATESRAAKVFLSFSVFPKLEVTRDGGTATIVWRDLRFSDRRKDGFLCEVKVAEDGRILSERIAF
jgi:inner membrane protein